MLLNHSCTRTWTFSALTRLSLLDEGISPNVNQKVIFSIIELSTCKRGVRVRVSLWLEGMWKNFRIFYAVSAWKLKSEMWDDEVAWFSLSTEKNTNEKTETNLLWKIDQFKQLNVLREYTNVCKIVANQSAYCSLNLFYQAAGSKQMIGMHLSLEQINSPLIDTISSCLLCVLLCVLLCAQRCRLTGIKCNQLARCARAITALEHHRVTSANAASRLVHDKQRRRKNLRFGFESSTCAWS